MELDHPPELHPPTLVISCPVVLCVPTNFLVTVSDMCEAAFSFSVYFSGQRDVLIFI